MRTLSIVLAIGLIASTGFGQTIRRVNNNPGVTGVNVYTTPQAAHNAAAANDIILIEPSSTTYGNLILTKPLKVFGNGYFLDVNQELKADARSSTMGSIVFDTGSGGSEIQGLELTSSPSVTVAGVSNITVKRCRTYYTVSISTRNNANTNDANVSNVTVAGNFIGSGIDATPAASFTISNVLINNNIVQGRVTASSSAAIQNWIVRNNTFITDNSHLLANSIFENNVLIGTGVASFNGVTSTYNISSANAFSGGTGNQNSYAIAAELLGSGTGISTDESYQIKNGSPLKTAGSAGIEVGAYGGTSPYVVSGIPTIPSVTNMINTGIGSNSTPIQVTISVKSNN